MQKLLSTLVVVLICVSAFQSSINAQGIFLPASGAVNRGMGGATTGAALDAIGSLYWNPATIAAFERDEIGFGFEAVYARNRISSSIMGVGAGSTSDESGAVPVPSIGWVHQTANPNIKFGFGLFGAAGYSVNMPADATNPILGPALVGRYQTDASFFQMAPSLAITMTDRLAIGFGPVINMARIFLDQNAFVPPNLPSATFPRGNGTRYHWGLGAQLGFYYIVNDAFQIGGNIKTPMWFEPFRYHSETDTGAPRVDEVSVTLPMIISLGSAYKYSPGITFAADVRYLNYNDADAFGDPAGFGPMFNVTGLGWSDVFSVHLGGQFQVTERLTWRAGYMYVTDLFPSSATFFNVGSDIGYRHAPTFGGSYRLNEFATFSFAYNYVPDWGTTGPIVAPIVGPVPGTSVTNRTDAHIATFGINIRY